jgi:peptide/nickel transport system substrate-binding protein
VTRRDRSITALLVVLLAALGGILALPRGVVAPATAEPTPGPSDSQATDAPVVYREGVVGSPSSITPVTARTRSERTLVGLIFSGLVRLGPGGTLEPDLAASWTTDKSGQTWTVAIRPDATWQDGVPVTAADVVYTVNALKDPGSAGGMAASWAEVSATAIDDHTVEFDLASPIGGFLAALTQPLLPSHLLADIPLADLAASAFATNPVGSGPYALAQLDGTHAVLEPVVRPGAPASSASPAPSDGASSSPASPASASPASASAAPSSSAQPTGEAATPTSTPTPTPTPDPSARPIDHIEISFFETEAALVDAFRTGKVDAAAGLATGTAADLGTGSGVRVLRYPTTTLSAVLLNLHPIHPELANADVRRALLEAVDRRTLITTALGGSVAPANALVPPQSWAYDAASAGVVGFDRQAAAKLLAKAGWTRIGGKWAAPRAKIAYKLELLTVPATANPHLASIAAALQADWTRLGFNVTLVELPGTELATRLRADDFTAAVLDISMGLEPDLYPLLASSQVRATGSNLAGYQDPALDALLAAARAPGSPATRTAAWKVLLAGLARQMPILPLAWAEEVVVTRGLSGAVPRLIALPGDRYWDVLSWRLAATR